MNILSASNVSPKYNYTEVASPKEKQQNNQNNHQISFEGVYSKETAEAQRAQIPGLRYCKCNASNKIGKMFPEIDNSELGKNYLELRNEAISKLLEANKKVENMFMTGDTSQIYDKKTNTIIKFELEDQWFIEDTKNGKIVKDENGNEFLEKVLDNGNECYIPRKRHRDSMTMDYSYSYKMTEYDATTNEVKAETYVYNHSKPGITWSKDACPPYMTRIEYGKTRKDDSYLEVRFAAKNKNGEAKIVPQLEVYAKGYVPKYPMPFCLTSIHADKLISRGPYYGYETYVEDYTGNLDTFDQSYGKVDNKGLPESICGVELHYPFMQNGFRDANGQTRVVIENHPVVNRNVANTRF